MKADSTVAGVKRRTNVVLLSRVVSQRDTIADLEARIERLERELEDKERWMQVFVDLYKHQQATK
jgi:hypothetical protein